MAGLIESQEKFEKVRAALKAGQFADNPELEAQLANEAADWKGRQHAQKVEQFTSSLDQTPGEPIDTVVGRNSRFLPGGVDVGGSQESPTDLTLLNNAASAGVDIRTGLPADIRGKANLMDLNENASAYALDYFVTKQLEEGGVSLPDGVPAVFKDENSGRMAYWRPTQDGKLKATLVNPVGMDKGDFIIAADETVQIGAEVLAGLGGAAAGAPAGPAGQIGGAAVSVAATNAAMNKARIEVARSLGVPDEAIDKIQSDDLLYEALLAGGFELAGPAVVGAVRGMRNKFLSGQIDPSDLPSIKAEVERIKKLSDEIYETTGGDLGGGVRITPSLGGTTGNEAILVAEANTKRDALGRASRELRENEVRTRAATGDAIRAINRQEVQTMPRADVDPADLGTEVKGVLAQPGRTAEQMAEQAEKDQMAQMDEAAPLWNRERYASIQEDLESMSARMDESEAIAWDNFRTQIEYDPKTKVSNIVLRNSGDQPIPQALAEISQESQQALSDSLRDAQAKLVEDLGWKPDPETGMIPRQNLADATLDAQQLHVLLSHLKAAARKEDAGQGLGWRGQDIHRVIGAIEEQMGNGTWARRSSGRQINPTKAEYINASWALANRATAAKHDLFNTKAVREVFRTNNEGEFLAQPGTVRNLLFKPGNAEPLADVVRLLGNNPVKRAGMLDELNTLYRENVFRDGKFVKGQHDAFISQYNDHIRLITGDDSTDFIRNAADFGRVVERAQTRAKKVKDMLSQAYGRRLGDDALYGGNIARDMLSDQLTGKQVRTIRDRLNREAPELWGEVKANGLRAIEENLLKSGGNEGNAAALSKLLQEQGDRIGTMYGPQYLRNLQNMNEMMSAIETGKLARGSKVALNPPWLQVMRSFFGPLSPIQRKVTAGTRLTNNWRKNRMRKLLSDPDKLDQLVKWQRMSPNSITYMQTGFALLGAGFRETLTDQQMETLERMEELRGQNTRRVAEINRERGRP